MDNDINIIQMPCPESTFGGLENNLRRKPKSYAKYNTPEFREHCLMLVDQVIQTMSALLNNGLSIIAVLGIEYSPSCAVNYQYSGYTVHQQGIFLQLLQTKVRSKEWDVPFVGVNRRGVNPAIKKLKEILNKQLEMAL